MYIGQAAPLSCAEEIDTSAMRNHMLFDISDFHFMVLHSPTDSPNGYQVRPSLSADQFRLKTDSATEAFPSFILPRMTEIEPTLSTGDCNIEQPALFSEFSRLIITSQGENTLAQTNDEDARPLESLCSVNGG